MLSGRHVLIVEDDPAICQIVIKLLSGEGANVVQASSLGEWKIAWRDEKYDLVLLDLSLPDGDGLSILRQIREISGVPVIILTGKDEEISEVVGLELGADDYVMKPFRQHSLLARIKNALRRAGDIDIADEDDQMSRFEVRGWRFDAEQRDLISPEGNRIPLTAAEYRLLRTLFERPDEVISRSELSAAVFGRSVEDDKRSIDTLVSRLRAKFGSDELSKSIIRTVVGAGYAFNSELGIRSPADKWPS